MSPNSSYSVLLGVAKENQADSYSVLDDLKNLFYNDIDSRRRYACIATYGDLIDCLHRRDVLTDSEYCHLLSLTGQPSEGNAVDPSHVETERITGINLYRVQRLGGKFPHKEVASQNGNPTKEPLKVSKDAAASQDPLALEFSQKKRKEVYRLIVREIGRTWKDLARELYFLPAQISAIEVEHPRDLSSCVHKLLQLAEEELDHGEAGASESPTYVRRLCEALQAAGRADLARKTKKIMQQT